jgi:hypothetical protein
MLKRKTFFWLALAFVLLIVAARGYYLYNKPHASAGVSKAAFSIGADSLFAQYQADEHGADQKYLGKVIEVKGKLDQIQHNGAIEIWILSAATGALSGGGGINCQLFSTDQAPTPRPQPGELVTIKGRCTGFLMDVNLADCVPQ